MYTEPQRYLSRFLGIVYNSRDVNGLRGFSYRTCFFNPALGERPQGNEREKEKEGEACAKKKLRSLKQMRLVSHAFTSDPSITWYTYIGNNCDRPKFYGVTRKSFRSLSSGRVFRQFIVSRVLST